MLLLLLLLLKTSPNDSINELWKSSNNHTNIQYDSYNSTKEVLKTFHSQQENKLRNRLKCRQGSFFENVSKFSLSQLNAIWSVSQSKLQHFIIRYINNTLPTRKNLSIDGEFHQFLTARSAYTLNQFYTLLPVVNITWNDLLGDPIAY
jgi:hypothetical protein